MIITSLENEKIKNLVKLKDRKYRKKENKFLIETEHLVNEALKENIVEELIINKDEQVNINTNVPTIYVSKEIINRLSEMESPSNIMAVCKIPNKTLIGTRILMLDEIQDPGNLGTIIRSAKAFNIDTIILSPNTVDMYNSKVIRSTQGMLFHTNIIVEELDKMIDILKEKGIKIYGTKVDNGRDVCTLNNEEKSSFCLIMGNEGNGVSKEILEKCDDFIYISMNKDVESLNVGVATSILLYELNK